jgi:hypothetical protein
LPQDLLWLSRIVILLYDEIKILSTDDVQEQSNQSKLPERPPINMENELAAVRVLLGTIHRTLNYYSTSLEVSGPTLGEEPIIFPMGISI